MVGIYTLIVESLHDKFMINFKRKYTYIKGDYGSGKSLICSLVRDSLKKSLNIELACDIPVRVLTDVDLVFAYKDIIACKVALEKTGHNVKLFFQESFEYLVLLALIGKVVKLMRTYNYADSKEYESWEDYYTKLLRHVTEKYRGNNKWYCLIT